MNQTIQCKNYDIIKTELSNISKKTGKHIRLYWHGGFSVEGNYFEDIETYRTAIKTEKAQPWFKKSLGVGR